MIAPEGAENGSALFTGGHGYRQRRVFGPFLSVRDLVDRVGLLLASGDKRDAEILAVRHQILVLQCQIERPKFIPADRTIFALLSRGFDRKRLEQIVLIVKPRPLSARTANSSPATGPNHPNPEPDDRQPPPSYIQPHAGLAWVNNGAIGTTALARIHLKSRK